MVADLVPAQTEHVELFQGVKTCSNFTNIVGVEREVSQVGQTAEPLDSVDLVEGEVEPLEVDQFVQVLYLADDVVVQLQLLQLQQTTHVVDFYDVLVGQRQVIELPDVHVVFVEDAPLFVVGDDVLS